MINLRNPKARIEEVETPAGAALDELPVIYTYSEEMATEDGLITKIAVKNLPDNIKFHPGRTYITIGIKDKFFDDDNEEDIQTILGFLARHLQGDWGDLDPEDKASNNEALRLINEGLRIFSSYKFDQGPNSKVWIISYPNQTTTIMLPDEY